MLLVFSPSFLLCWTVTGTKQQTGVSLFSALSPLSSASASSSFLFWLRRLLLLLLLLLLVCLILVLNFFSSLCDAFQPFYFHQQTLMTGRICSLLNYPRAMSSQPDSTYLTGNEEEPCLIHFSVGIEMNRTFNLSSLSFSVFSSPFLSAWEKKEREKEEENLSETSCTIETYTQQLKQESNGWLVYNGMPTVKREAQRKRERERNNISPSE